MIPEKIRSIINPKVELPIATLFALLDAYAWKQEVAMAYLFDQLGLDYDGVIEQAIADDRANKK